MAMFQACKAALDIIGDCNMNLPSMSVSNDNDRNHIPKPTIATKKGKFSFFQCSYQNYSWLFCNYY